MAQIDLEYENYRAMVYEVRKAFSREAEPLFDQLENLFARASKSIDVTEAAVVAGIKGAEPVDIEYARVVLNQFADRLQDLVTAAKAKAGS